VSAADRFLSALGHAIRLRLEPRVDAHVRRAADEALAGRAAGLLREHPRPRFEFRPGRVRYGQLTLAGFENRDWLGDLVRRGIGTLELRDPVSPAALAAFADLAAGLIPPFAPVPREGLLWAPAGVHPAPAGDPYPLDEELVVMQEVFAQAERGAPIRQGDAMAVVARLDATLGHRDEPFLPLLHQAGRERYQPAHALNTALLAMAVANALRLGEAEQRECGLAALLHDIGMARLPAATTTGDRFTQQDRARVRGHPLEGARLLLRQGEALETAAVVSYEHHLRQDGSGYPRLSYPREPHLLSRVVAVCDAYDALLAPRPERPAFDPAAALREIERGAVVQFDPRVVGAFSDVVMRGAAQGRLALTLREN
jgi:hypothetical protein